MKKSWLIVLSCILVLGLILTGCGGAVSTTPPPATSKAPAATTTAPTTSAAPSTSAAPAPATSTAAAATINIRIAGGVNQGHPISVTILDWKKKLEERSNGRVKVTFYEAETMGKTTELYDEALNGTVEAVHTADFWAGGRFPITEGLNSLPFLFTSIAQQTQVYQTLYDKGLLKELDPFKFLYFTSVGTVNIFTAKTKISTMADFKGQKLRASGVNVKSVEALGGTALTVPGAEEYTDLDKGILTGNLTGADNVVSRKEYEVLKYGIQNPISAGGFYFVMNKKFWDSLPKDIQDIINTLDKEEQAAHVTGQTAAVNSAWDTLKTKMEVYSIAPDELAKWKQATSSVSDAWIKTMTDKGLPMTDIMKVVNDTLAAK